ncbi:interleukin-1 beta [Heterodontus francisci]|uniref:interleukin-1 beta n=1 Tax=Heterodontus francisci TaxID=7792 RepID=UPI00355B0F60
MRTQVGPVTIPMAENESRRTYGFQSSSDSCLTSPTSRPLAKGPTAPNLAEASAAAGQQSERGNYQLRITGTSSTIAAVGDAKLSLEKAVMLVLAVEKFKKQLRQPSADGWAHDGISISDIDLLGDFDALVEEAITCISADDTEHTSSSYRFLRSERQQMKDDHDRSLILSENLQLLAMFVQQPKEAAQLDVRYYKTTVDEDNYLPVVLGIGRKNLFLSCTGPQDRPRIRVEKWDENLQNISSATDLLRFVFFKKVSSSGLYFELESALYRDWYVSTSQKNRQPVEMDIKENHNRITIFTAE